MAKIRIAIVAISAGVLGVSLGMAAPPQVALVENVTGSPTGVGVWDYVEAGKVIALGPRESIILNYMNSCVRETITGGTVTVGTDQSETQGSKIVRTKVPCDAGKMVLTSAHSAQFGGRIFRSPPLANGAARDANPHLTLYGRAPIVEVKATGALVVERIDQANERYEVDVTNDQLVHGRFYDFAKSGRNLAPGGIYRISSGGQEIVFQVDRSAKPGSTPIMGRLLRLGIQS